MLKSEYLRSLQFESRYLQSVERHRTAESRGSVLDLMRDENRIVAQGQITSPLRQSLNSS